MAAEASPLWCGSTRPLLVRSVMPCQSAGGALAKARARRRRRRRRVVDGQFQKFAGGDLKPAGAPILPRPTQSRRDRAATLPRARAADRDAPVDPVRPREWYRVRGMGIRSVQAVRVASLTMNGTP